MDVALQTIRTQVDLFIEADDKLLPVEAREAGIKAALARYSRDRPGKVTEDVTGDGGRYYPLATSLSKWVAGFSRVAAIQYPAPDISADETPVNLKARDWDDDYWLDVDGTQTQYLFLPRHAPALTEAMRITYTAPYTFSGSPLEVDMPQEDFFALCHLAAGLCLLELAAKFAKRGDSSIAADAINWGTQSGEAERRGKEFIRQYEQHLGLSEDQRVKGAATFVELDVGPSGRSFLSHGRR